MIKKLIIFGAGALTTLAFGTFPAIASAGEFNGTCTGAACTGTIESSSVTTLEGAGGSSVKCSSATGNATMTNASATGTLGITFHFCVEETLGTECHSAGQPNGTIMLSTVWHWTILDILAKFVGPQFTSINVTFSCASGLVKKTVTGNVMGELVNPACGTAKGTTEFKFAAGATTGTQKWTQITTTGTVFDLTWNNDSGGAYETMSLASEGKIKWGGNVTLDC